MIVSRCKVILGFLGMYLIFGFLTGFGFSEKKEWTFEEQQILRETVCIAGCINNKGKVFRRWSGLNEISKVNDLILLDYFDELSASCVSFRSVKSG